jgi:hypothetical protein
VQAWRHLELLEPFSYFVRGCMQGCMRGCITRSFPPRAHLELLELVPERRELNGEPRLARPGGEVSATSDTCVRLAQKMAIGPCIPVGVQPQKAEVGPTSGPTWRFSHCAGGARGGRCAILLCRGTVPSPLRPALTLGSTALSAQPSPTPTTFRRSLQGGPPL